MNIYILILISLIPFLACSIVLACSFNELQKDLIDNDAEYELLYATYSNFQKLMVVLGFLSWGFTLVHGTIAAAMWVKELM